MKTRCLKGVSLLLLVCLLFTFAACGGDPAPGITTAPETTTDTVETTTAEMTTAPVEDTTAGTEETTTEPDASGETTTAPSAGLVAPVGTDKSAIAAFYNNSANATKAYTGKVTVLRNMGTETTITKMMFGLKQILQAVLDRELKPESETKTFVNGKDPGGALLENFLPRGKGKPMSELAPAGVKSASCTKDGTGWRVELVLNLEQVNDLAVYPKHHTAVMDPLEINPASLDPFTLESAKVVYGKDGAGAKLVATVNADGYLDKLVLDAPLTISGKLGYKGNGNIETVIEGKWYGDMTFTYA